MPSNSHPFLMKSSRHSIELANADISRLMDPSYHPSNNHGVSSTEPARVYIDRRGQMHDPDFHYFPVYEAAGKNNNKRGRRISDPWDRSKIQFGDEDLEEEEDDDDEERPRQYHRRQNKPRHHHHSILPKKFRRHSSDSSSPPSPSSFDGLELDDSSDVDYVEEDQESPVAEQDLPVHQPTALSYSQAMKKQWLAGTEKSKQQLLFKATLNHFNHSSICCYIRPTTSYPFTTYREPSIPSISFASYLAFFPFLIIIYGRATFVSPIGPLLSMPLYFQSSNPYVFA
ncbi:hypothetical protein C8J55DRAFT_489254 [Lentinula edodes]|uniref:Uncharacterized protein n=1 Tax=Lentinula lateritia TaxID=40482 RepID=A0A9W9ACD8_9AGAR|nr:hypothetical protein C8J55DRAFT_489254 [Lentinula edodes]